MESNLARKNLFFSVLSLLFSVLQSLWFVSFVTKTLGTEAYGYSAVISSFINISTILSIAVTSMSTRFINIEIRKKHRDQANQYFNSIIAMTFFIGIIIFLFFTFMTINIDHVMQVSIKMRNDVQIAMQFSCITLLINIISSPFLSSLHYKNKLWIYYLFTILSYIFKTIIPLIFYQFDMFHIWTMPFGGLIIEFCAFLFYVKNYRVYTPELKINVNSIRIKKSIEILKSGIWVSVTKAGATLQSSINSYLSNILTTALFSGVYSTIMQFQNMVNMFASLICNCFVPTIYKKYVDLGVRGLYLYSNKILNLVIFSISVVCGLLLTFGIDFIGIWLNSDYSDYYMLFLITIAILPISVSSEILNQVNITLNEIKVSAIVTLVLGVFCAILSVILSAVFDLGIYGIAIAQFVTLFFKSFFFFPIYTAKQLKISPLLYIKNIVLAPIIMLIISLVSTLYRGILIICNLNIFIVILIGSLMTILTCIILIKITPLNAKYKKVFELFIK